MTRLFRKLADLLTLNFWREIPKHKTPGWVKKGADSLYFNGKWMPDGYHFFKGNNHVYRVWFETHGQGNVYRHYYIKRRTY